MASGVGYTCRACGRWHEELPFSYHASAPASWSPTYEDDPDSELGQEQCVIKGEHFFIRGLIRMPVNDADRHFEWGVWVSLSEDNFLRACEVWQVEGRETEPAMLGWLSTALPTYEPSTLNLKTTVSTQPVGFRPLIEVEPTDHPLALEQRLGISLARVQELADRLLHPSETALASSAVRADQQRTRLRDRTARASRVGVRREPGRRGEEDRTPGPLLIRQPLSPLSYTSEVCLRIWAERTGDRTDRLAWADPEDHGFEEIDPGGANPATGPPQAA